MKDFKGIIAIAGLLLFECSQPDSKHVSTRVDQPVDTASLPVEKEEQASDEYSDEEELEASERDSILLLIALFKEKNIDKISNKIAFPLNREYPIPPIQNKAAFKQRFSEVFDKTLIDKIANSKIEQWREVGWRGIALDHGVVWMANSDGIITTVNYQSDFEKQYRAELIAKEKEQLHPSLKTFENPEYRILTENYRIRIDELANDKYRYASWKKNADESSKPDLILSNGELEFQGSGGNHVMTFVSGNYVYKVYRNMIAEKDTPDITLEIEKNGKTILTEGGSLIIEN
ncbi:hypothetical protein [Fluviicola sp.]|uniref:hypothetical protein n=1 Tax=Fluviicola sp. TaxID=1917219 RepID=UPI0031D8A732